MDKQGILWGPIIINTVLVITSGWALKKIPFFMRYARGALRLHLATGLAGVVAYSIPHCQTLVFALKIVHLCANCLSLPLVASELHLRAGLYPDLAPLNLVIPCYILVSFFSEEKPIKWDLLAVGQFLSLSSLIVTTFYEQNPPAGIITILYMNTCFRNIFRAHEMESFTVLMNMVNIMLPIASIHT